jgi:uncharacterized protein
MRVGVISDTHGLLRPEALDALRGSDHILHGGDVGNVSILEQLRLLAPLTAIRGNIDRSGPCAQLPATQWVELAGYAIYMLHDVHELDLVPKAAKIAAVVSGHSHKPGIAWRDGVLYFNPGSAGPRRFSLPISVGLLELTSEGIQPRIVELDIGSRSS